MSTVLTGAAGEYYVAALLSQTGWTASITPRNADRTDVLAQHVETGAVVAIQVKTSSGADRFRIGAKDESAETGNSEWFICVRLPPDLAQRPRFYVLPRMVVSALLYLDHRHLLATPGKGGKPHEDSPVRVLRVADIHAWEDSWTALGLEPYVRLPIWAFAAYAAYGLPSAHPLHDFLRGEPPEKTPASSRDEPILAQIAQIRPDIAERFMRYV